MPGGAGNETSWATISFSTLIKQYVTLQSQVVSQVRFVASRISAATPGKFLLLQFSMSQVTQVGETLSNLVGQVNSVIKSIVSNYRGS
ncbi:MAG: hypothetical protein JSS09_05140 [Verrucomicrobia bacterium]|nr:hypothetical protein [Verrucomicrobiota bacterium]